jgi:hypothetical protein
MAKPAKKISRNPVAIARGSKKHSKNIAKLRSILDEIHEDLRRRGVKPLSMREIDKEIKACRHERRKKMADG